LQEDADDVVRGRVG